MVQLLDGKKISQAVLEKVAEDVRVFQSNGLQLGLATLLVGEDPASQVYVGIKQRTCAQVGIHNTIHRFPVATTESDLVAKVEELNQDSTVHGILVQLPLPDHVEKYAVLDAISHYKDVDGLTSFQLSRLDRALPHRLEPCTPKGIMTLLRHYNIPVQGQHAVVLGRSDIVGKPIGKLLYGRGGDATVTYCHRHTSDLRRHTLEADILVSAVGRPNLVTAEMVAEGAVVIDVGTTRMEDPSSRSGYRLVGDVDFERVKDKCSYITPVPGGVGPLTVASLMQNVVLAAQFAASRVYER